MTRYNLRAVLSDRCNYRCVFCSHDFNRCRNRDIPPGFLKECVKIFAFLGGEKVAYRDCTMNCVRGKYTGG